MGSIEIHSGGRAGWGSGGHGPKVQKRTPPIAWGTRGVFLNNHDSKPYEWLSRNPLQTTVGAKALVLSPVKYLLYNGPVQAYSVSEKAEIARTKLETKQAPKGSQHCEPM